MRFRRITLADINDIGVCYTKARVKRLMAGRRYINWHDVKRMDIPLYDKLWIAWTAHLLSKEIASELYDTVRERFFPERNHMDLILSTFGNKPSSLLHRIIVMHSQRNCVRMKHIDQAVRQAGIKENSG